MANILLIDDDQSLLQMMGLIIQRIGHQSLMTTNPLEGVEMARTEKPDMAIIDLMMPDVSGFDVCRMLREDEDTQDIPLLILTAVSQEESRQLAMEAGADEYLTKPITKEALKRYIEVLLETGARNVPVSRHTDQESPTKSKSKTLYNFTQEDVIPAAEIDAELAVVGVIGLTNSVGATTLGINLALGAMQFGRSCIIDLQDFGNVAAQLKLAPAASSWADLVQLQPGADKTQIGQTLLLGHSSGVAVLAAPNKRMDQRISPGGLVYMLRVLNEAFSRLIVLLPTTPNPMSKTAMQLARQMISVAGDDPTSTSAAAATLEDIEAMGLKGEMQIVLNRSRPHGLSFEEAVSALDRPITTSIPYEANQIEALTTGRPMLMLQPESLYARSIIQLSRQL